VGKVALVRNAAPPCIAGAYFIRLRFKDSTHPVFAATHLRSPAVQDIIARQAKQAAQPNFSGPLIRALPMPVPPKSLQDTFAARIKEISALETVQAASRKRLDDLFQSLLHRAFQGEL
jgi:type I restriction enzyme S subunit